MSAATYPGRVNLANTEGNGGDCDLSASWTQTYLPKDSFRKIRKTKFLVGSGVSVSVPPSFDGVDELVDSSWLNKLIIQNDVAEYSWSKICDQLIDISALKNDWDGMDAPAPSRDLLDVSSRFAEALKGKKVTPPSRVCATVSGTILFEWQLPEGRYFEFDLVDPESCEWMLVIPGQKPTHGSFSIVP